MTEEQYDWFITVGGMQYDGLRWSEAMVLCTAMGMPKEVGVWLTERKRAIKKKEQTRASEYSSELM